MADQEPLNPILHLRVKNPHPPPEIAIGCKEKSQLGRQPRPGSRPWVLDGGGDSFSVTSALLWCSVQSLLVGVARETPSGGGNKTARTPAQPVTASLRAVACEPPSSCQVSVPPGRPPRVPATARAPGTHLVSIGFSGPVAALSLARKVCRKSDPRREVVGSGQS